MSTNKKVRVIDQRNLLYGRYKYQVKLGRFQAKTWDILVWCEEQWGPRYLWNHAWDNHMYRTDNPRWHTKKRTSRSTPDLYIANESDAMMFSLRWAE